jgi:hypothetical protein
MDTALDELPDVRHPCCAQQLAQLSERTVLTVGQGGDHEGTLTRAPPGALAVLNRLTGASVAAALHQRPRIER